MTDSQPAEPATRNPLSTEVEVRLILRGTATLLAIAATVDDAAKRAAVAAAIQGDGQSGPVLTTAQAKRLVGLIIEHHTSLVADIRQAAETYMDQATDRDWLASLPARAERRLAALSAEARRVHVEGLQAKGFSADEIQRMLAAIGIVAAPATP